MLLQFCLLCQMLFFCHWRIHMRQGFTSYKDGTLEELLTEMQAELSTLPKQEAKVVQFILLNVDSLSFETGRSIAEKAGVSEVTVGRALRRFGCDSVKALTPEPPKGASHSD